MPSTTSRVAAATATGIGRRMIACASRYQPPSCAFPCGGRRRTESASIRGPSRAKRAGRTVSAMIPASGPTRPPAMPIERRKPSGKTASVATAAPTVTDEKAIVRPAVRRVVRIASGRPSSSRYRETSSRL